MHEPLEKIQKIWNVFSENQCWENFAIDYSIHKKMFLAFQPGPCYYWLLNVKNADFEMMSPEVENVLGYSVNQITFPFMLSKIHLEDLPYLLNFETALGDFLVKLSSEKRFCYKIQYDFRLQKADGTYIRILNQMVLVQYEAEGSVIRTFGVQADITHLKKDLRPVLSFIAFNDDDPSYYDIDVKSVYRPSKGIFSPREKQVLVLMLEGMLSKEICVSLNISKHTVDTHRKNMLEKSKAKSISELIKKSLLNGWV